MQERTQAQAHALNLNIHVLDGAYLVGTSPPVSRRIEPPRETELQALVERLAERIGRALERLGHLRVSDAEARRDDLGASPETRVNGHDWLARKLKAAKIPYTQCDNAFVGIEDVERAQRATAAG